MLRYFLGLSMEYIRFKGRILPPIFSLMQLHSGVVVGYDDNIIGDERWWISDATDKHPVYAVKTTDDDRATITVSVSGKTRVITVNENPEVYSDKQREYIKQTFDFFAGK